MARKRKSKQKEIRTLKEKSETEVNHILYGGEPEGSPRYPRLVVVLASEIQEYSEGKTLKCDACGSDCHNVLYDDTDLRQSFCCNCIRQAEHLARTAQIAGIDLMEIPSIQHMKEAD